MGLHRRGDDGHYHSSSILGGQPPVTASRWDISEYHQTSEVLGATHWSGLAGFLPADWRRPLLNNSNRAAHSR